MRLFTVGLMLACTLGWARWADADEVIFLNGDRLTGKILSAEGGKLILKTDAAGEVTIDMAKVRTFSTDEPVDVRVGDKKVPHDTKVTAGPEGRWKPSWCLERPPSPWRSKTSWPSTPRRLPGTDRLR